MKNKKNSIFVTSDFIESQYLWIIPIIEGFASKQKIKKIIFEKQLSKKLLNEKHVKTFIKNNNIIFLKKNNRYLKLSFLILSNFFFILKKLILFKKLIKNRKKDWTSTQINHGIWDLSNSYLDEKNLKKNFLNKFISIVLNLEKIFLAKKILKIYNPKFAFMGHTVYSSRSLLAILRNENVKIFTQASFNLHGQYKSKDNNWGSINKKKFIAITNNYKFKIDSKNYWSQREIGKGSYEDSKIASIGSTNQVVKIKNYIFLHIFRDSPFNTIDNNRIFDDYFDWIKCTLEIINKSSELWEFRFHPSHKRWGEDQKIIFNNLIKKLKLNKKKNIFINNSKLSNITIFKNANKIITFSGTSQYEAVAYGLRPIVINSSPLEVFEKNIVIKPKSYKDYEKILLNKNSNFFKNSLKNSNIAKDLIFFREKILRIKDLIDGIDTYRNDTKKISDKNYNDIRKNFNKKYLQLYEMGENLLKENTIYSNIIKKYLIK